MVTALLVVALVWLLVVTVLLAGVVRHLGGLQAAGVLTDASEVGFNFDTDGPWIPSVLPERAVAALSRAGFVERDYVAVFFSAGCGTCLDRAQAIAKAGIDVDRTLFLLTGSRERALDDFRQVLEPTGATLLADPEAHDIVKALDIQSTPFAFRVTDRQVVGKAYVRSVGDFVALSAPSHTERMSGAADANGRPFQLDLRLVGAASKDKE
jgi:hypothetical protein